MYIPFLYITNWCTKPTYIVFYFSPCLFLRISVTPFLFEATKLQIKIDFSIIWKHIFKKKLKNRIGIVFLLFLLLPI